MVAADLAFRTDEPLSALVLLSPTFVNEAVWRTGMANRRKMMVFITHGRSDNVLGFESSRRLADAMTDAGLIVTWVPFEGGHEIPSEVVTQLNEFILKL